VSLVRYAERPDLRAIRHERLSRRTFPTYMHHNQSGTRYWGRLYEEHPDFQLALLEGGAPVDGHGPDGRIFYAVANPRRFPALMSVRPGDAPREVTPRYLGRGIGVAAGRLLFDELDLVRSVGLQADLHLLGISPVGREHLGVPVPDLQHVGHVRALDGCRRDQERHANRPCRVRTLLQRRQLMSRARLVSCRHLQAVQRRSKPTPSLGHSFESTCTMMQNQIEVKTCL
jgi:hypothetical protein